MKAAIYRRVSTLEQAKEGNSLQAQFEALIDYAKKMNYEIVGEYCDDGFSAASLNRPALQRLIGDIKDNKIDIVLIYKQDRLSRRVKDIIELVELFIEHNIKLHSLSETIDWLSSSGRAMLKMMATFSEMERENIAERSKMGRDFKAKAGIYSNKKNIPIGYEWDAEKKELIPHETEAEQIKKIFELYLNGWSMRKISKYMSENYTNRYKSYNYKLSAKNILYNPVYAGFFQYSGELIKGKNIRPIIDMQTFLTAEKKREQNRNLRAKSESPYLLVGLMWCGLCGQRYSAKRYDHNLQDKKYVYYRYGCEARLRFDKEFHSASCKESPILNYEDIEKKIIEDVKALRFDSGNEIANNGLLDILIEENSQIKDKIKKLLDLYENNLLDKQALEERILGHNKKIEKNDKLIAEMLGELKERPTINLGLIKEKIAIIDSLPLSEKRTILKALISKITVYPNEIKIKWNVK